MSYPVDDAWRLRAKARMEELGINKNKLAIAARCSRSLLTELLRLSTEPGDRRDQTPYLPEIHKALQWPPPQAVLAPGETPELSFIFERLDAMGRKAVLESARHELDRLLKTGARAVKKS